MEKKIKGWRQRVEYIYTSFSPEFWKNAEIVDVGSSTGKKGICQYVKKGASIDNCIVIDAVEKHLSALRDLGYKCLKVDLESKDLSQLEIGVVDLIICSHLLEHVTAKCERRLLNDFVKMGKNVVICYPQRVKRINKRQRYAHKRNPDRHKIYQYLIEHFEEIISVRIASQVFLIAKNNKFIGVEGDV